MAQAQPQSNGQTTPFVPRPPIAQYGDFMMELAMWEPVNDRAPYKLRIQRSWKRRDAKPEDPWNRDKLDLTARELSMLLCRLIEFARMAELQHPRNQGVLEFVDTIRNPQSLAQHQTTDREDPSFTPSDVRDKPQDMLSDPRFLDQLTAALAQRFHDAQARPTDEEVEAGAFDRPNETDGYETDGSAPF